MTRKSRREIERAVEDLADGDADDATVRAWLDELLADGWTVSLDEPGDASATFGTVAADGTVDDPDHEGEILVAVTDLAEFWIPGSEVPDWVDRDALPVRA